MMGDDKKGKKSDKEDSKKSDKEDSKKSEMVSLTVSNFFFTCLLF